MHTNTLRDACIEGGRYFF